MTPIEISRGRTPGRSQRSGRIAHIALMLSAATMATGCATMAGAQAADAAPARCLALPTDRVAIQTYVFMGQLAGFQLPADSDSLPIAEKVKVLTGVFAKGTPAAAPPEKIEALFKSLHAIGYRNIESSSSTNALPASVHAPMLKRVGLHAIASHESLDMATWPATLAKAKANGQVFVGSGGFGAPGLDTLEHTLETARNLNTLGKQAADQGMKLYVHNHSGELTTRHLYDRGDGKPVMTTAWEIITANTDPKYVFFEVDIFWTQLALGPGNNDALLSFLNQHRGRIALLHMKDMAKNTAITDLGTGIIDWPGVVDAAGPAVKYYIFEFDLPDDPMKSARIAFDYLTCGGARTAR